MSAVDASAGTPALRRLLPVLYIGVFMAALDTAVIAPAIPALRAAFGLDHRTVSLVMTVYVLFSLAATAPMAALGDRWGRRPVYLASVALFALGSLLIAVAPNFALVLLGRAIQGVGGGGIIPTASAVIGDACPPEARGRALGLVGAMYGMAFVLGPPLAGVLMVALSWHWIFLANLPIAAALLALGMRVLPRTRPPSAASPFDVGGLLLLCLVLSALVLGITRVADDLIGQRLWPWWLGAAALLLPLLVAWERRSAQPLIPIDLFANRRLARAYVLTAGAGFGMGSVIFLTSIATLAHGVTPARAGFVLLPMVLCSMLASTISGRQLHRLGPGPLLVAGFGCLALGYAASALAGGPLWVFLAATMPVGLGVGVVVGGALRSVAIDEAPPQVRGAAQGLINIFTSVGTLLAAAVVGAVADFAGGGADGFGHAYLGVAACMLLMAWGAGGLGRAASAGTAARG
ncbi:MAG TPA: MFS transporter [Burkholderiaceae bacterium]|nr:MFS transporter [Burkholderiaceae bacterium]